MKLASLLTGAFWLIASGAGATEVKCAAPPAYLSDSEPAFAYLEARQGEIYKGFPKLVDPYSRGEFNKPEAVAVFKALAAKLAGLGCDDHGENCVGDAALYQKLLERMICTPLSTRYESPLFQVALENLQVPLEALRLRDYPETPKVLFGSLPGGSLDAEALKPKGATSTLAILNRDVFLFTGSFSKALSDAVPIERDGDVVRLSYSPEAIQARLRDNPHITRNFADAMIRLVREGTSQGAAETFLDADHARLHMRLVSAMDFFIVAHEQGHAIKGHLGDGQRSYRLLGAHREPLEARPSRTDGVVISVMSRSQKDELEADEVAFRLYAESEQLGAGDPVALMIGAASAHVIFRLIETADRYKIERDGYGFGDANHPSAADRNKNLDRAYSDFGATDLKGMPDFRKVFDVSLDCILIEADPLIRRALNLSPKPPSSLSLR